MSRKTADAAFVGGQIRTLDPRQPFAQAVAWRDGVIIAVGSDAEIREVCDQHTRIMHLQGTSLVPGLVDSHFHPIGGVDDTRGGLDLMDCRSLDELCARLKTERERLPEDRWVLGYGLGYGVFSDGGINNRQISEAVGHSPLMVTLSDFHAAVVTQKALDLAGITGPVPFASNSEIVFANGKATGELREIPAIHHVAKAIPPLTEAQSHANYLNAFKKWNAMGLTGMHAMDGTPKTLEILRKLEMTLFFRSANGKPGRITAYSLLTLSLLPNCPILPSGLISTNPMSA